MKAFCAATLLAATQAAIEQVHITYTGVPAKLAVDFVASNAGPAAAYTSIDGGKTWKENPATTFNYPTIGYMSQAELDFTGVAPGAEAQYFLEAAGENTTAYTVTPVVAGPEKFAGALPWAGAPGPCAAFMASLLFTPFNFRGPLPSPSLPRSLRRYVAQAGMSALAMRPVLAADPSFPPSFSNPSSTHPRSDFGIANDVCLTDLVSQASKGAFDSVLHGAWAGTPWALFALAAWSRRSSAGTCAHPRPSWH